MKVSTMDHRDDIYEKTTFLPELKEIKEGEDEPQQPCCAQRWIVAYMGLWFGIMQYLFGANMSVGVVCMVKEPEINNFMNISSVSGHHIINASDLLSVHLTQNDSRTLLPHQNIDLVALNLTKTYNGATNEITKSDNVKDDAANDNSDALHDLGSVRTKAPMISIKDNADKLDEHSDIAKTASEHKGILEELNEDIAMLEEEKGKIALEEAMGIDGEENIVDSGGTCELASKSDSPSPIGEFEWDKSTQSMILSGFFYGYIIPQIPGGWLSGRFGGKVTIGVCMSMVSVLMLLTPWFARMSAFAVVASRAVIGIATGVAIPGWFALTGVWALANERSRFIGLCFFGQMTGTIIAYSSSGLLCVYGFGNGWESIFYVHGLAGLVFVLMWVLLVQSSPSTSTRISLAEQKLLNDNFKIPEKSSEKALAIPWRKIFTYPPLYVMAIAHMCDSWTFYLLFTCMPMYLKEVLKVDMQNNGILSSLPFLTMMIGIGVASILVDWMRTHCSYKITAIRKSFQCSGFLGVAIFILIPGYLTCEQRNLVIFCLCMCTFFQAAGFIGGYTGNPVDMAPRYSSIIFGITNTFATSSGIIAPYAVASLTQHQTTDEWRTVLFISSGVSVLGIIVYGLFANSDLAPWANEHNLELDVDSEGQVTLVDEPVKA